MRYTEIEIQEVKTSHSLTNLLSSLNFNLSKHGKDFKTLCPFHEDSEPSLIITPSNNLWHCMGCNEGGSVIDFIMKYKNLSFLDAMQQLKVHTALQIPSVNANKIKNTKSKKIIPRVKLLERVMQFYQKTFKEDKRGLNYLKSRGITNLSIFESFRIGFCNGTLFKAIPEQGEIIDNLKEIGILQDNNRESFENCVVFPLLNESGTIVSLYGRKIINTHNVDHLYLTGSRHGLFNGIALKSYPEIILTESIIDSLSLIQAGIKNTVPCYGTNGFTEYHLEQLKRNNTKHVTIIFDNDKSGEKGSITLKEQLKDFIFSCEIKQLPKEKDINNFLVKHGETELQKQFEDKKNKLKAPLNSLTTKNKNELFLKFCDRKYIIKGIESSTSRLRANIKAQNCTRFHIDTFDLYSAKARKSFIRDTSILFKSEQDIIENDMLSLIGQVEQFINSSKQTPVIDNKQSMSDKERAEALRYGKAPTLINKILKDSEILGYLGEQSNKLISYLAMTSRKMSNPISIMILSASGAGKSALQDTILKMCPPEDLEKLTSVTEKALFYKDKDSLKHKVLALAEEAGAEEASYAIRNLISSKELIIEATVKDSITGRMTTMKNIVYGPTAVFKTTTNPETDAETKSRFIILAVDESRDQTRRVLAYQRQMQTLEGFIQSQNKKQIIKKHHNFQRLLKPLAVFNPYARLLTYQDKKLWARRDNPKYLQLINTIAFLHQLQRPLKKRDGVEYIEVIFEDIAIANELSIEILGRSCDDLSSPATRLLEIIKDLAKENEKTGLNRREIREASGWGETYVRRIINELVRLDYLSSCHSNFGKSFTYELNDIPEQTNFFENSLINIESLKEKALKLGMI